MPRWDGADQQRPVASARGAHMSSALSIMSRVVDILVCLHPPPVSPIQPRGAISTDCRHTRGVIRDRALPLLGHRRSGQVRFTTPVVVIEPSRSHRDSYVTGKTHAPA